MEATPRNSIRMVTTEQRVNLSDPSLYVNRELSWLGFNERVLAQAKDGRHPLLDRVRFVAISETNLDEFFMIRVAGLQQQVASELPNPVPDGMTPEEQLLRIHDHTEEFFEERRRILNSELMPALEDVGVRMVPHARARAAERTLAVYRRALGHEEPAEPASMVESCQR